MFIHIPIALIVMLLGAVLATRLGAPRRAAIWSGWFAGACACVMREITQHEYRWIETVGQGKRAVMPVLEGLSVWDWNAHSIAQTLVALSVSGLVAVIWSRGR